MENNTTIQGILLGQGSSKSHGFKYYQLTVTENSWKKDDINNYYFITVSSTEHGCGNNLILQFYEYDAFYDVYKISNGFPQTNGFCMAFDKNGDIKIITEQGNVYGRLVVFGIEKNILDTNIKVDNGFGKEEGNK